MVVPRYCKYKWLLISSHVYLGLVIPNNYIVSTILAQLRKVAQSYVAVAIIGSSSLSALAPGHSQLRRAVQFYVVFAQAASWGWFNNNMILVTSYL